MTDQVPEERRAHIADDPFCALLGIELTELGPGTAETTLDITEGLCNFHGMAHGGAVNALADAAFAAASNSHERTALALETNVSFLEAIEPGATLTARAREVHVRGRTGSYGVEVTAESGELVAVFRGRVYRPE